MEFDLVKRLGVKIVEVDDLDVDVAYVPRHGVALLKAGLSDYELAKAADWILEEATRPPASSIQRPKS